MKIINWGKGNTLVEETTNIVRNETLDKTVRSKICEFDRELNKNSINIEI